MAFEIYNGTASTFTQVVDKLIEMWDFDESDTTSSEHTATYGNAKIGGINNVCKLYNEETSIYNAEAFQGGNYTVVKSENSILASWIYSSRTYTLIVGNLTNIDGTTGKGAFLCIGNTSNYCPYYLTAGENVDLNVSLGRTNTDVLTQLVPYVSRTGGWVFDNAYRTLFDTQDGRRGLYTINNNRYYISEWTAIKEE